ncbi:hypothetical protein HanPSC8_Chr01g0021361 [Helianthus annuus]|nr:hypothetical protein HanPSC8_Chr01g0021361 [Helianthus annuus]
MFIITRYLYEIFGLPFIKKCKIGTSESRIPALSLLLGITFCCTKVSNNLSGSFNSSFFIFFSFPFPVSNTSFSICPTFCSSRDDTTQLLLGMCICLLLNQTLQFHSMSQKTLLP